MADPVLIEISAKIDQLLDATSKSKSAIESIGGSVKDLGTSFTSLTGIMQMMAAVAAGGMFKEMVDSANNATAEVNKLTKQFGMTLGEASNLRAGLLGVGVSVEDYSSTALRMVRMVKTQEEEMRRAGMATRDASGAILDQKTLVQNALSTLMSYEQGVHRNIAAFSLFGRSAADATQMLRLTAAAMERGERNAKELGLTVSQQDVSAMIAYKQSVSEMNMVFDALQKVITDAVLPYLTEFARSVRDQAPAALDALRNAVSGLTDAFGPMRAVMIEMKGLFGDFAGVVKQLWDALSGGVPLGSVAKDFETIAEGLRDLRQAFNDAAAQIRLVWRLVGEAVNTTATQISATLRTLADVAAKAMKLDWAGAKAAWEEGMRGVERVVDESVKRQQAIWDEYFQSIETNAKTRLRATAESMRTAVELAAKETGKAIADGINKGALDAGRGLEQLGHKRADQLTQMGQKEREISMASLDTERQINQLYLADLQARLQQGVATYRITETQKFLALKEANEQKFQDDLRLMQEQARIASGDVVRFAAIQSQILVLKKQHENEMQQLTFQSINAQTQRFMQYFEAIQSAWDSQWRGILTGTTTFTQAAKNALLDLTIKAIGFFEKMALEWVAQQLGMTTATSAAAASRASIEAAAAATGAAATLPIRAGKFMSDITADAAAVFGGVFANLAPLMGPAAAGPATAASSTVLAGLAAVPKFDVGTPYVPQDMLAIVHRGEAIIPAAQNSGGPMGGGGINFGDVNVYSSGGKVSPEQAMTALAGAARNMSRGMKPKWLGGTG